MAVLCTFQPPQHFRGEHGCVGAPPLHPPLRDRRRRGGHRPHRQHQRQRGHALHGIQRQLHADFRLRHNVHHRLRNAGFFYRSTKQKVNWEKTHFPPQKLVSHGVYLFIYYCRSRQRVESADFPQIMFRTTHQAKLPCQQQLSFMSLFEAAPNVQDPFFRSSLSTDVSDDFSGYCFQLIFFLHNSKYTYDVKCTFVQNEIQREATKINSHSRVYSQLARMLLAVFSYRNFFASSDIFFVLFNGNPHALSALS